MFLYLTSLSRDGKYQRNGVMSLTDELQAHARDRGLDPIGCTSAQPFGVGEEWLEADPRNILSEAQALVIAACYLYGIDTVGLSLPGRPRGRFGPWTKASFAAVRWANQVVREFLDSRLHQAPRQSTILRSCRECHHSHHPRA